MAIYGTTLDLYLQQKWDKAYSLYLDPVEMNRLIRECIFRAAERKYMGDNTQKDYDELSVLMKTEKVFGLNNNKLLLSKLTISTATVAGIAPAIVTINTLTPHNVAVGDSVTITGITGISTTGPSTNPNGTFTVATVPSTTSFTYSLGAVTTIVNTYALNSGSITNVTLAGVNKMVPDYYHYFTARAKYTEALTPTITAVSRTAVMVVTTSSAHNLRTGDSVTIAGATGSGTLITNLNATHRVTMISRTKFSVPASGLSGTYTSGGTLTLNKYRNYLDVETSNEKTTEFKPSKLYPKVEFAEKLMKLYPDDSVASEVTLDYLSLPAIEIDVADATNDLTKYYTDKFLYFIMDTTLQDFATQARDMGLYQTGTAAMVDNP